MAATDQPRKRMSAPERREQLLAVARGAFAEKGYDAVSVEEIAQRAGVTKPVVYEHFGGKEGIYAVIVDREVSALFGRLSQALQVKTARGRVEAAADEFLGYIEERPDGFRVMLRDTSQVDGARTTWTTLLGDLADQIDERLAEELDERGFDRQVAPLYSRAVIGGIANVGQWWLETGEPSRSEVAAHIANLIFNGLRQLEQQPTLRTR
jgi:AcrR family transcriptional regulator